MDTLSQDLRQSLRFFVKSPGLTLIALTILALSMSANTVLFSVITSVIVRPLPYPASDRLVRVGEVTVRDGRDGPSRLSNRSLPRWRGAQSFEQVAGYGPRSYTWLGPDGAETLYGAAVSPAMFTLLRVRPLLGRLFTAGEEHPGAHRVVLLSHQAWLGPFAQAADIVGTAVNFDGASHTIVGVLPETFYFPDRDVALWTPLVLPPNEGDLQVSMLFSAVARLRNGITIERARAEARTITQRRSAERDRQEARSSTRDARVMSLQEEVVREVRPALLVFSAAVFGVLGIAVTNVSGLLLTRSLARRHELALRAALGASGGRLARQLLTESLTLSLCGGAIALLVASWMVGLLPVLVPREVARLDEVRLDVTVLALHVGLSMLVGVVCGAGAAVQGLRVALLRPLNEGPVAAVSRFRRSPRTIAGPGLVILQVALALVLLIGAGLLLRSFVALVRLDAGYDPANVVTAQVDLPGPQVELARLTPAVLEARPGRTVAFADRLLSRLAELPGLRAAGVASSLPLMPGSGSAFIWHSGRPDPPPPSARVRTLVHVASPGVRDALGLRLRTGRFLTSRDTADSRSVVVVNESLARAVFGRTEAVGRRLRFGGGPADVVGVIQDVTPQGLDAGEPVPELYVPYRQHGHWPVLMTSFKLAARVEGDPLAFVPLLRDAVAAVIPTTPLDDVMTMESRLSASVAQPRFYATFGALLAAVAVSLAAVGLYGLLAHLVSERRREIGIRMTLGAERGQILALVLRQGGVLVAVGMGLGLPAAVATTRLLSALLFDVTHVDRVTFVAVPLFLAGVALLACYLPARHAASVDPANALRSG